MWPINLGIARIGINRSEKAMLAMKMSVVFFIVFAVLNTNSIIEFPVRATTITIELATTASIRPHSEFGTSRQLLQMEFDEFEPLEKVMIACADSQDKGLG